MKLHFLLFSTTSCFLLSAQGCQNAATPSPGESSYPPAELSDCLGKPVHNLIYRYEGYLPGNPKIRPGCEVRFGIGISNGGHSDPFDPFGKNGTLKYDEKWHRRETLKYFVMDADDVKHEITRDGDDAIITLTTDLYDFETRTTTVGLINVTWTKINFPEKCYGSKYSEQEERKRSSWTWSSERKNTLKVSEDNAVYLGRIQGYSTSVYCEPPEKSRLLLLTSSTRLPSHARISNIIQDHDHVTLKGPEGGHNRTSETLGDASYKKFVYAVSYREKGHIGNKISKMSRNRAACSSKSRSEQEEERGCGIPNPIPYKVDDISDDLGRERPTVCD